MDVSDVLQLLSDYGATLSHPNWSDCPRCPAESDADSDGAVAISDLLLVNTRRLHDLFPGGGGGGGGLGFPRGL